MFGGSPHEVIPEYPYRITRDTATFEGLRSQDIPVEGVCVLKLRDGKRSNICTGANGCGGCDYPGARLGDFCDRTWAGASPETIEGLPDGLGWGQP